MSTPGGGVLLVTVGSTDGSKNSGSSRASSASSVSPPRSGKTAPARAAGRAAAGDGRLPEMPHERLLAERQIAEGVGIHLHHRRFADALQQVRAVRRRRRRGRRRCGGTHLPVAYISEAQGSPPRLRPCLPPFG